MKTSAIERVKNDNIIIIRESYIKICGDLQTACLLSYFEYWHNVKVAMNTKAKQINDVAERHGEPRNQDESLYQYHTIQEIYDDCMGILSIKGISKARKRLKELGFITEHNNPNPKYKFDNTTFYLLNIDNINKAISEVVKMTISSSQNDQMVTSKRPDGNDEMTRTRTETSSETTQEIKEDTNVSKKRISSEPSEVINNAKLELNKCFNRRDTTQWSEKEIKALKTLLKRNDFEQEMLLVTKLYKTDYEYKRRSLQTLLNNWTDALDVASNYFLIHKPVKPGGWDEKTRGAII